MGKRTFVRYLLLAAGVTAAACTVHQTEAPPLTGPSTFALSVTMSALPDSITQDGGSQSSVKVTARNANGQPVVGQTFRMDVMVNGVQIDYGTLSARTAVTGSDGTAFVVYTSPPPQPNGSTAGSCGTIISPGSLAGQCVNIAATPISSNFAAAQTQTVTIRLVPLGVIIPAAATPTPAFTNTPASPTIGTPVVFDASTSCGGPTNGGSCPSSSDPITSYAWDFGDGSTGSGRVTTHSYQSIQTFPVSLTVTNSEGATATTTKTVAIAGGTLPTANFTVSPDATANQQPPGAANVLLFNADSSTASPGHAITIINWDFGDSHAYGIDATNADPTNVNSASGLKVSHYYSKASANGYVVTLSIADDAGQKAVVTKTVKIGP